MNSEDDPPTIESALAEQEAQVARLDHELAEARARLAELRETHPSSNGSHPPAVASFSRRSSRLSVREKVVLFRALFHGREDVYPRFWHNEKSGTVRVFPCVCQRVGSSRR